MEFDYSSKLKFMKTKKKMVILQPKEMKQIHGGDGAGARGFCGKSAKAYYLLIF